MKAQAIKTFRLPVREYMARSKQQPPYFTVYLHPSRKSMRQHGESVMAKGYPRHLRDLVKRGYRAKTTWYERSGKSQKEYGELHFNAQDLRAHREEIIVHEVTHAAVAYLRLNGARLISRDTPSNERLSWLVGEMSEQCLRRVNRLMR